MSNLEKLSENEGLSQDTLFNGDLSCLQHQKGYRFSIDAVLLAHFAKITTQDRILDLGTGSGIVSLILLYRWGSLLPRICGIEVQESLATLFKRNFKLNGYQQSSRVIHGNITDIKELIPSESYDKVVCNPPFYPSDSGRKNQNGESMVARHQVLADLKDFLYATVYGLKNGGKAYYIYPAKQLADMIAKARDQRLEAKKIQFIYSYPCAHCSATLVLVELKKNAKPGVDIMEPLYIYTGKNGSFTPEVNKFYLNNPDRTSLDIL